MRCSQPQASQISWHNQERKPTVTNPVVPNLLRLSTGPSIPECPGKLLSWCRNVATFNVCSFHFKRPLSFLPSYTRSCWINSAICIRLFDLKGEWAAALFRTDWCLQVSWCFEDCDSGFYSRGKWRRRHHNMFVEGYQTPLCAPPPKKTKLTLDRCAGRTLENTNTDIWEKKRKSTSSERMAAVFHPDGGGHAHILREKKTIASVHSKEFAQVPRWYGTWHANSGGDRCVPFSSQLGRPSWGER